MKIDTKKVKAICIIIGIFFILVCIWETIGGNLVMTIVYLSIGILWTAIGMIFQRDNDRMGQ